jgi:hypothetical protein
MESTKIGTEKNDTQSRGERKEDTADVRQKKNERDSTKIGTAGSDTQTVGERKEDFANKKVNSKAKKKRKRKRKKEVKVMGQSKKVSFDLSNTPGTTKSVRQVNGSLKPALKQSPLNLVKSWTIKKFADVQQVANLLKELVHYKPHFGSGSLEQIATDIVELTAGDEALSLCNQNRLANSMGIVIDAINATSTRDSNDCVTKFIIGLVRYLGRCQNENHMIQLMKQMGTKPGSKDYMSWIDALKFIANDMQVKQGTDEITRNKQEEKYEIHMAKLEKDQQLRSTTRR